MSDGAYDFDHFNAFHARPANARTPPPMYSDADLVRARGGCAGGDRAALLLWRVANDHHSASGKLGCLEDAANSAEACTFLDPGWAKGWWRCAAQQVAAPRTLRARPRLDWNFPV